MGLCCPLPHIRVVLIILAVLVMTCGGLIVWLGRRLQQQELTKAADIKYYPLVIIAFGGWLIVTGMIGVASAWFRRFLGVWLYIVLMTITTVVLIALAAVGLHLAQNLNEALDDQGKCKGNDYLSHANDAVLLANEQICTAVCPCKVEVDTFGPEVFANITIGSATRIQDCNPCESLAPEMQSYRIQPDYCASGGDSADFTGFYYSLEERRYFDFIKMLERDYRCAGICEDVPYFAFTDVNRGRPQRNCREELQSWVQVYPLRYTAVIVAVNLALLVSIVFACCYVCHPFRKGSKGYDRARSNTQV